jgi:hypothetical protein
VYDVIHTNYLKVLFMSILKHSVVRVHPTMLGLPLIELGAAYLLSVLLSIIVGSLLVYFPLGVAIVIYRQHKRDKDDTPRILLPLNGYGLIQLSVVGLPLGYLQEVNDILSKNERVVFWGVTSKMLQMALNLYVRSHYGIARFVKNDNQHTTIAVTGEPVGKRLLYVTASSVVQLESQVSHLVKTGATPLGSMVVERGFFSASYIQPMQYMDEPDSGMAVA